jgi:nucleoside 2-deoxyribosyltransferase
MPYTVFVSHSSRDTELIAHVRSVAEHARVSLYLAEHDNQAGRSIAHKVQENLDRSDAVLVLLTHDGYSSAYVQQEIGYAIRAHKPVLPLLSRELQVASVSLSMLGDAEYIVIDFDNPADACVQLSERLSQLRVKKNIDTAIQSLVLGIAIGALAALVVTGAQSGES